MVDWSLLAGASTDVPVTELTRAKERKFSFPVTGSDTCSFSINARTPEALQLLELATDVHALREGTPVFSGRLGATNDSFDKGGHTVACAVSDVRGLLGRRLTSVDRNWTIDKDTGVDSRVDVAVAVRTLLLDAITDVLGRTPNPTDLGISLPTFPTTGILVSRASKAGAYVAEELAALQGGGSSSTGATVFDWDVTPGWTNRTFQLWTPQRGRDLSTDIVLRWVYDEQTPEASDIESMTRAENPKDFANQVRITGGVKTMKVTTTVSGSDGSGNVTTTTTAAPTSSSTSAGSVGVVSRGTRAVASNTMTPIPDAVYPATEVVTEVKVPTTPVDLGDGRLAWDIGPWGKAEEYTDIVEQTELATKAATRLVELGRVVPAYTLNMKQGWWQGPDHVWKGDTIRLQVRDGRIVEDRLLRVQQIDVTVGSNGDEKVSLTVGSAQPADEFAQLLDLQRSVAIAARASQR